MGNGVRKIERQYDFGRIVVVPGKYIYNISYWGKDGEFSSIKVLIPKGEVVEASIGTYNNDGVEFQGVNEIPLSILNHKTEISDLVKQSNSQTVTQ